MEKKQKKNRILGWIALGAVIAGLVALYFWMDARGYLAVFESTETLQEYVGSFGVWAPLVFILLQIAQVIFAPIPGNVTTLAGGAMFGFWPAMAYSVFAVFVGSMGHLQGEGRNRRAVFPCFWATGDAAVSCPHSTGVLGRLQPVTAPQEAPSGLFTRRPPR